MNKNQVLQQLSYDHCKALYKGGDTHYPNVLARDYVNHMFITKSNKFCWNDFSVIEKDHLIWGVKHFRSDLAQGLFDQPEPDEQPEQVAEPEPIQGMNIEYVAVDEVPQVVPGQIFVQNAAPAYQLNAAQNHDDNLDAMIDYLDEMLEVQNEQ